MHLRVARIVSGGPLQTFQRACLLPDRHVRHAQIQRHVGKRGILLQRRQPPDRRGEIVGPQIQTPQIVVQARPVTQLLPLDLELLARFVVALLCEQTRGVLNPHHVVVGIAGKGLLELSRRFAEKPVLHQPDGFADVGCRVAAGGRLRCRSMRPKQQHNAGCQNGSHDRPVRAPVKDSTFTTPSPSRTMINRSAEIAFTDSRSPLGHRISRSADRTAPKPKCSRRSFADK